jgi:hypothetical protein
MIIIRATVFIPFSLYRFRVRSRVPVPRLALFTLRIEVGRDILRHAGGSRVYLEKKNGSPKGAS